MGFLLDICKIVGVVDTRTFAAYAIKVVAREPVTSTAGEVRREIVLPKVDAVVANPPYTRWVEIAEETRDAMRKVIGKTLKNYGLSGGITREMGIYIPFIVHGAEYLKRGGRLGMIISNSWLQADYGVKFANYLLDNFKIKAVIDFSSRLFRIPLIATCVILLEREPNQKARERNQTVFLYIDKEVEVKEILNVLRNPEEEDDRFYVNVVKQADLPRDQKWIGKMFQIETIEKTIQSSPLFSSAESLFEPRYGNVTGVSTRGGTGADAFFYLTKDDAEKWGLDSNYIYSMLVSPRYSKSFTFKKEDWKKLKDENRRCYVFIAHKPRSKLPENVREYIRWGETTPLVKPKKRGAEPKTADKSLASTLRKKSKKDFYGWYDLGGLIPVQISVVRRAWRKARFVYTEFPTGLDEGAFVCFVPRKDTRLTEKTSKGSSSLS
ncbi:MAG: Eco57I restriction-modification methylase domain-containing protein [Candidatus Bathyarchaeia archaeon]